ncbi:MAG: DUF2608 domain-containing protein [Rickettsiaceae bacterium]|nr:DUF2608 domain-containing protein [Rickettsiaceae bacterium]
MRYCRNLLTLIIICLFTFSAKGEEEEEVKTILEVNSFSEIANTIDQFIENGNDPTQTLVILSLKNIFAPTDRAFYQQKNYLTLLRKSFKKLKPSKSHYYNELVLSEYENTLVDKDIPKFIQNLFDQGMTVIVFSENISGNFNDIPYFESWTIDLLQKHKININQGKFKDQKIVFKKSFKVLDNYPTFYNGLISANRFKRKNLYHQVISRFLFTMNYFPKNIIMVHNNENDLKTAETQIQVLYKNSQILSFLHKVPFREKEELSPENYLNFMNQIVKKLNKVRRKTVNNELKNPYEE